MATVFNGNTLEITLDAPTNSVLTIDVQRLYSEWKEWMLSSFQNMGYPPAFRPDGGSDLTPGIKQGAYYFLRNDLGWRIKSTAASQTIYVVGNLTPEDSTLPLTIEVPGFTVTYQGLQPITQNVSALLLQGQDSQYRGIVHIDQANGVVGTEYPIGLDGDPVNNITDAKTILERVGGNEIRFRGTLTLDQDIEGFEIHGSKAVTVNFLALAGYSVDQCYIERCFISGNQGGSIVGFEAYKCGFQAVTNLAVGAERCSFHDNVTLKLNSTNIWLDCKSGVAGNIKPQISGNGGDELQVRGWIGGFDLRNVTNSEFRGSIDFTAGRVAVQDTCTAGEIVLGGDVYKDYIGTGGMTIVEKDGARAMAVEALEGNETMEQMMRLIRAAAAGKIIQQTDGSYVIRDAADTKPRISGALAANNGRNISLVDSS